MDCCGDHYPKNSTHPKGLAPVERDLEGRERVFRPRARPAPHEVSAFIDKERGRFGVEPICRELEVSARAYRERRRGQLSRRGQRDRVIVEEIRRVHAESDSSYGSWRCWKQLNRDGTTVARCTVERLMRQERLIGVVRGKTQRTTTPGSSPVPAADLVKRCFTASRPDELWVADFERHEALLNRAVVKGHRLRLVAAGR